MIRIFLPLICAALGFAAASCSQSEGPLAPAETPTAPGPAPHGSAAAAMASPLDTPQMPSADEAATPSGSPAPAAPSAAADPNLDAPVRAPAVERRASTLIGVPVVSADGSALGSVKDIIFDRQGRATHLVIAYGTESGADRKLTAMPWDAAMASIKDGRLVLGGAMLQGAPSFTADTWPNLDDPAWSAATDTYWRKAVRAAIAAHPGTPIDSTSRQRGRGSRGDDGN